MIRLWDKNFGSPHCGHLQRQIKLHHLVPKSCIWKNRKFIWRWNSIGIVVQF